MKLLVLFALLALTACSPQEVADKVMARTAQAVITPVVGPQAALCIVEGATPAELRAIAVDYGVEAGTSTVANIMRIAQKPQVVRCIAQAALLR